MSNQQAKTSKSLFRRTTTVAIDINASAQKVWDVLSDTNSWTDWNSTVTTISGKCQVGEVIKLKSILDAKREFNLKVIEVQAPNSMTWSDGQAPFFKGDRVYTLSESNGVTTFSMSESLGGIMAPIVLNFIPDFDDSFNQFAADLKKKAEQ